MKGRFVQKVVLKGNSAMITIARPVMFGLELRPGDLVEITVHEEGYLTVRPWQDPKSRAQHTIGRLSEDAPAVPR